MIHTNILYFNEDIDIRICLKNGSKTLLKAWAIVNNTSIPKPEDRYQFIMQNQNLLDPPFRAGSYRIAIKRDPVERFLSTVNMVSLENWNDRWLNSKWNENLKTLIDSNNISKTIENLKANKIKDQHFMSQTHYMGKSSDYDKVYYVHELPELLKWLEKKTKVTTSISDLWVNKAIPKYNNNLSEIDKLKILNLYNMDCANGWH